MHTLDSDRSYVHATLPHHLRYAYLIEISWTAVAQGGVIYGIEKSHHTNVNYMSAMTKSYGILIDGNLQWLVRKGDLVLAKENRNTYSSSFRISRKEAAGYCLSVYTYLDHDEDDDVPLRWQDGQHGKLSQTR